MVDADKKVEKKFKDVVSVFLNTKPQPRTGEQNSKPRKKSKSRKAESSHGDKR